MIVINVPSRLEFLPLFIHKFAQGAGLLWVVLFEVVEQIVLLIILLVVRVPLIGSVGLVLVDMEVALGNLYLLDLIQHIFFAIELFYLLAVNPIVQIF